MMNNKHFSEHSFLPKESFPQHQLHFVISFLIFTSILVLFSPSLSFSQEISETSNFDATSPLENEDFELDIEEDPFETEVSADENNLEKDFSEADQSESTGLDLGMDEDPFETESIDSLDSENSTFSQDMETEEEEFQPKIYFDHEVSTILGGSETKGLFLLDPKLNVVSEYRFVTTYDQSVKVQTSKSTYNHYRLSISFSQNYEANQKRFFDGYASLREIYSNYRTGSHQIRYGTQLFDLGKVDFDQVIDVLHLSNIMSLYTFEQSQSKTALPAIKYNWFNKGHTATVYLAPIRQQTFGMKFTELREEVEDQEESKEEEYQTFLRDYFGLQYKWTDEQFDVRIGLFHWFDSNPLVSLEYQRQEDNGTSSLQSSFEKMLGSYSEKETRSNFLTLELDANWKDVAWKMDAGYFKKRTLYSYHFPESGHVVLSTVKAPNLAWATSLERTFPYFYWLMLFSQRKFMDVPENTHILMYENNSSLLTTKRDLTRNQATGIVVFKTPKNDIRVSLLAYQTWPFEQTGMGSLLNWDYPKEQIEMELKYFRLETDHQKMLGNKIQTNQLFLTFTQKFSGN